MLRGEIWLVKLDPTVGSEIQKTRPAVIISNDAIGVLAVKVIIPFTKWNDRYEKASWIVRVEPDEQNGLGKVSAADGLQIRAISPQRLVKRIGVLKSVQVAQIIRAVMNIIQR